jgi:arginine/lysine/ornithine decarboxylase
MEVQAPGTGSKVPGMLLQGKPLYTGVPGTKLDTYLLAVPDGIAQAEVGKDTYTIIVPVGKGAAEAPASGLRSLLCSKSAETKAKLPTRMPNARQA